MLKEIYENQDEYSNSRGRYIDDILAKYGIKREEISLETSIKDLENIGKKIEGIIKKPPREFLKHNFAYEDVSGKLSLVPDILDFLTKKQTQIVLLASLHQTQEMVDEINQYEDNNDSLRTVLDSKKSNLNEYIRILESLHTMPMHVSQYIQTENQLKLKEVNTKLIKTFIERTTITNLVGASILILLVISIIVFQALSINVSEIIKSTMLLILGYFFGEKSSQNEK